MCYETVGAILDSSKSVGSQRLLLVALAHHKNFKTGQCNPSIKTLAAECKISERSIHRNLKSLVALGELQIESGAFHSRSNRYSLRLPMAKHLVAGSSNPVTHVTHSLTPASQRGDNYFHRKRRKDGKSKEWNAGMLKL